MIKILQTQNKYKKCGISYAESVIYFTFFITKILHLYDIFVKNNKRKKRYAIIKLEKI